MATAASTLKSAKVLHIAILGAGPAGLFMFKRLLDCDEQKTVIHIFERKNHIGVGFPYSTEGAGDEHITNVSGNEIPKLITPLETWIHTLPKEVLTHYHINPDKFNAYKVLPRLLFGKYLEDQFTLLIQQSEAKGIITHLHLNTVITNVTDDVNRNITSVQTHTGAVLEFDRVIICSGHHWPVKYEGKVPAYFESPYPPSKLSFVINCPVAIRGSSLTAIDAIKTLARYNGSFLKDKNDRTVFHLNDEAAQFKITMFSRNGLLPAVRFHLDDSHLSKNDVLNMDEINESRTQNDGFLSFDYVFETKFKAPLKEKQPWFYEQVKEMTIEAFVNAMMDLREKVEPFNLFEAEYTEAEKSIKRKQSVPWKEMLAVLSFVMNYPAKYFSAEDTMRLQNVLMPLISVVIAFVPQSSVEELLALHKKGILELIPAGDDSFVEPANDHGAIYHFTDETGVSRSVHYSTYIDCVGQPHLSWKDIPYKSLIDLKTISKASVKFRNAKNGAAEMKKGNKNVTHGADDNYYLLVPGIKINDYFQVMNESGVANERIFMMAVPYIGGFNPDYSGLDFGEAASGKIIEKICAQCKN